MSTSTEARTHLLELSVEVHSQVEHLNMLTEAIMAAGLEGVVQTALTQPEAILATVANMNYLVNVFMLEKEMCVERIFELEDELEKYQPSTS